MFDDIFMLITTAQDHILYYNTVWVILFVVAASLLLYRTAVPCTFVPFLNNIRLFRAEFSIEFVVALWATSYFNI